jgi:hypothetical protein
MFRVLRQVIRNELLGWRKKIVLFEFPNKLQVLIDYPRSPSGINKIFLPEDYDNIPKMVDLFELLVLGLPDPLRIAAN